MGINYAPEHTGIAPYTTEAATALHRRGHDVSVVTGFPHYPSWRVDPRYGGRELREVMHGVAVHRLRHHVPARSSVGGRLRMEAGFGSAAIRALERPVDVTIAVSPALVSTAMVLAAQRLRARRTPVGVWVQDLYGAGARETGLAGSTATAMTASLERRVLRSADAIAVVHDRFRTEMVDAYAIDPSRVTSIPNWTHITPSSSETRDDVRARWGWRPDDLVLLHAGNMGVKQHLDNLVSAAREIDSRGMRIRIVLVGDGNQRRRLQHDALDVRSLDIVDPVSEQDFPQMLGAADILVVNEKPGVRSMSVPSKLTSYFASGRPVLAAVDPEGVTAREMAASGAGRCIPSGDPQAVIDAALRLAADDVAAARMGERGLSYSRTHLDRESGLTAFEDWVRATAERGVRRASWR
ncbi:MULTISPECIES: glycosyltransferase family 4 protein [unclassified Rhodococcus (in: high G+C Gram-positive bacteria)]|uniref:glycosyltransferase family 4 protein n=1 Tax=unclassified Rhodococcus (in: high G+C Gram-positive bacteria) TaxID=192944 RepID=UPI001C9B9511|nr:MULTISPECIES: glycosyltransferase family 4 protein [unclassified Rhodococcus (in: high G+C Gram-positive bacteria)]MBY6544191.1 glycosyltransferase family 4 protein [Rhodococcus sp. BP-369]MBY6634726.1 glycosyltransferase family 4 protein [Rhodococcus sp. BP-343]MBY6652076.1 glycosyltransferase family 4 protein [Rhodococcus sp. BP-339]